ncbi:MAG: 4Fe-4S binding protein [Desulfarculus sp.]|nr:4Fe-4S binding protein [Desulfarculus sp.]
MSPEFTTDPHERLAAHLDAAPLGAPPAPELMAILRTLFSPAEAELAAALPFAPVGVAQLAQELDRPSDEVGSILADLAERGLCFERQTPRGAYYGLLPVVPGLAETQFMGGVVNDEKRRLARLFADYYGKGPGPALVAAGQRGAALPRVIPVGRAVTAGQEILPFERAEAMIRQADYICLGTCYCRQEAELNGHGCGAPKDVCLTFGPFAEFLVGKGLAQAVDFQTAMGAMERAEMAGLVHVTANVSGAANFICNCCGCCCLFLKTVTQLKRPGAIAAAGWLAVVDPDNCVACGQCQEVCQVAAPQPDDETMAVDASLCLGCGHCALACPTGAIAMQPRPGRQTPPFVSYPELTAAMIRGRMREKAEEGHA